MNRPCWPGRAQATKPSTWAGAGGSGRVAGREDIVHVRLRLLLTALGELPAQRPAVPTDWRPALRRFLDGRCPPGTLVLHGRSLPNRPLVVEHLVVAPRGLVVVGHELRPGAAWWLQPPRSNVAGQRIGRPPQYRLGRRDGEGRGPPAGVGTRDTAPLLCAQVVAGGRAWDGVPVLAAVCGCPAARASAQPWLMIDGLWLGTADQLPDWLVSEEFLDLPTRVELYRSLTEQMPIA